MEDYRAEKIKRPLLVPVAFSILIFLACSLILISWLQKRQIEESVFSFVESTRILYEGTLRDEAELIKTLLDFHDDNKKWAASFKAGNREVLFNEVKPVFDQLKKKYRITHFYFITPDKQAFLRMYNPEKFGDKINRYTLDQAEIRGAGQSGVELGSSGTLSLRVDMPWVVDGEFLGYIEFGKEIDHIIPELGKTLGVDLLVVVGTDNLDREKWEKGRALMGHKALWSEIPDHVVVGRTIPSVPEGITGSLELYHDNNDNLLFKVAYNDMHYRGGIMPLFVADGRVVGEVIAMRDFAAAEHSMHMLSGLLISLVVILSAFLFIYIYGVTSRVEQRLKHSREDLEYEIRERVKAEKLILEALNEKQILLNEIHHRVKNNMQIVCSLFRLQLAQIKDPKVASILRDSQSRISAMALIHKTLYQPKDQSSVYFEEYIKELASSIFDSYAVDPELITLKCDLDSVHLDIDTVVPCGLIINELVTNSIKYAFPDNRYGEVSIIFKVVDGGGYLLSVKDNGVGMPGDFDVSKTKTLGLHLTYNLAENQLKGRIETESSDKGTEIRIFFSDHPGKSKV